MDKQQKIKLGKLIRLDLLKGMSYRKIAKKYNINPSLVNFIANYTLAKWFDDKNQINCYLMDKAIHKLKQTITQQKEIITQLQKENEILKNKIKELQEHKEETKKRTNETTYIDISNLIDEL